MYANSAASMSTTGMKAKSMDGRVYPIIGMPTFACALVGSTTSSRVRSPRRIRRCPATRDIAYPHNNSKN
jgi:hypothetical protein